MLLSIVQKSSFVFSATAKKSDNRFVLPSFHVKITFFAVPTPTFAAVKLLKQLQGKQKEELIEQINKIDFHQIMELYEDTKKGIQIKENKIENITYLDKAKLSKEQRKEFDQLGEMAIKNQEYAVVTMAGGQGTRLRT